MKKILIVLTGIVLFIIGIWQFILIDFFELFIYNFNIFNLNISLIISRIFICIEFIAGTFFITKQLLPISKNLNQKKSIFIIILISLTSISAIFLISPPDTFMQKHYSKQTSYNSEELQMFIEDKNFTSEKLIFCFFGTSCQYCELAAIKLSAVLKRSNEDYQLKYFFLGKEEGLDKFFINREMNKTNYSFIDARIFLTITDGKMPLILLIENKEVHSKYSYRDIIEKDILQFLEKF